MSTFVKVTLLALGIILIGVLFKWSSFIFAIIVVIWLVLTIIGSFHMRWNYHLKAIHANRHSGDKIALTFDDGPDATITPQILALLKDFNAKATFFCIGKNIEAHPKLLMEIHQAGHQVGNHSYSHSSNFGFYSSNKVLNDINKTNKLIFKLLKYKNNLFRPPFGVTNPSLRKATHQSKMKVIGWKVRSYDTMNKSPESIYNNIIGNAKRGDIILLHDTQLKTVGLVEKLLIHFKEEKMKLVTIAELFK